MNGRRKNDVSIVLRSRARDQRSMLTRAEALFWQQVRAGRLNGHKFRRQVPIAPYIVDFLCSAAKLVIELDGPPHESPEQRRHDGVRDQFLTRQGFRVMRFSNDFFLGNPQLVLDRVLEGIETTVGPSPDPLRRPPSPAEGRGKGGAL